MIWISKGYDTLVGERGGLLSGGQRQVYNKVLEREGETSD